MRAADANDVNAMRAMIKRLEQDYQPDRKVVDWVWLEQVKVA